MVFRDQLALNRRLPPPSLHFGAPSLPGSLCWELDVHEIFISYSSKQRNLTRELAAAIEAQYGAGAVWWDQELESRASYSEQIKAALEKARVVGG
jgi:hypothetical protein